LRLPRDLSGHDLAKLLRNYGYEITRQAGSHIRLSSNQTGVQHHITVPAHKTLKMGTLSGILSEVATYLKVDRRQLEKDLFEK
jgi:predicted RNA binding protein YcfA (HicA-like mRNA interferase family)